MRLLTLPAMIVIVAVIIFPWLFTVWMSAFDWKIGTGGNSGIFYRVTEDGRATYETGPEMQVLDDARHPDGRSRLTAAGP